MGMGIYRGKGHAFEGVITNANHAEPKIQNLELSHQRSRAPRGKLTETGLINFKAEAKKLLWLARVERPDLMFDVSEATQLPQKREMVKEERKVHNKRERETDRQTD